MLLAGVVDADMAAMEELDIDMFAVTVPACMVLLLLWVTLVNVLDAKTVDAVRLQVLMDISSSSHPPYIFTAMLVNSLSVDDNAMVGCKFVL